MTIDNWDDIVRRVTGGVPAGESALDTVRTSIARLLAQLAPAADRAPVASDPLLAPASVQGGTTNDSPTPPVPPAAGPTGAPVANSALGTRQLTGVLPALFPGSGSLVSPGVLPSLLQTALPSTQGSSSGIGDTLMSIFTSSLGLSPLISGLLSLFGGGGGNKDQLPPLVKFALPSAVNMQAGVAPSGAFGDVSYGQNGLPRMTQPQAPGQAAAPAAPQITVQVQAMDSKSFLDHSEDIARAVRDAMLYSHSLNDVVADL